MGLSLKLKALFGDLRCESLDDEILDLTLDALIG